MGENKPHLSFFIYHPWPKLIEEKHELLIKFFIENIEDIIKSALETLSFKGKLAGRLRSNSNYWEWWKIKNEIKECVKDELKKKFGLSNNVSNLLLEGFENKRISRNPSEVVRSIEKTIQENYSNSKKELEDEIRKSMGNKETREKIFSIALVEGINKKGRLQHNFSHMLRLYKKLIERTMNDDSFWRKIEGKVKEIFRNDNNYWNWESIKNEIKEFVKNELIEKFGLPEKDTESLLEGFENKRISRNPSEVVEIIKETIKKNYENCPKFFLSDYLESANIYDKYEKHFENLKNEIKNNIPHISVKIHVYKCIVGLGNEGPFEVGMTMHPIFGIPYILGSAVKGLFKRAFILWCKLKGKDDWEKIFPTPIYSKEAGEKVEDGLCFTDAIPEPKSLGEICLDIMCPHIKLDREIITEFENPTPIPFCILKDSHMRFYVYPSERAWNESNEGKEKVKEWLSTFSSFLNELKDENKKFTVVSADNYDWILAFGAKTSSGYGIFKVEEVKLNDRDNIQGNNSATT